MFIILYMFLKRVGEIFTNSSLFAAWGGGIVPEEQEAKLLSILYSIGQE